MAVITSRTRRVTGTPKILLPAERYYRIIKAIQAGYGKSNFYQQKVTNDPRPIKSLIIGLSGMSPIRVMSDLKYLMDKGLVVAWTICSDDVRSHHFVVSGFIQH
jgi:hypothetical protein